MDKQEQQNSVLERHEAQQKRSQEIISQMQEEGFTNFTYTSDAEIKISGKLMTDILNLLQNHQLHNSNVQDYYQSLANAQNAVLIKDTDVLLDFLDVHLANCRGGVAISEKDKNTKDAEEKIQPL